MNRILAIISLIFLMSASVWAQEVVPRIYVLSTGSYTNKGDSWENAKNDIQEAINTLRSTMNATGATHGEVFVGAGVYTPTKSTETGDDGVLYTSFVIEDGISVYGGFSPTGKKYTVKGDEITYTDEWQQSPGDRIMANGLTQTENEAYDSATGILRTDKVRGWDFHPASETVMNGDHNGYDPEGRHLVWNGAKQQYDEMYSSSSYHVVWFAVNGFFDSTDDNKQMRAKPLKNGARIDGFTVTGGYAMITDITKRHHTSYGGGIYMVNGSTVANCRVRDNAASRRGGGIYMDGGGTVDHCYISGNQARGLGLIDGYGGGVALDHLGIIRHCVIVENVASMGGGASVTQERDTYPDAGEGQANYANAFASSLAGCVIGNNTATTEGGGLYMKNGGTANHLTIVRNHNAGASVSVDGHRYGRSGGVFIDTGGVMFNSVVWGNTTASNGRMQYGSYINNANQAGVSVRPYVSFSAFSGFDEIDWTGTDRESLVPLQYDNNRPQNERGTSRYYPEFILPSPEPEDGISGVHYSGKEKVTNWKPRGFSDLVAKGICLHDYLSTESTMMGNATLLVDIFGNHLSPRAALGAYVANTLNVVPSEVPSIEGTGNVTTLFVDPDFQRADTKGSEFVGADGYDIRGNSWNNPLVYLCDALSYQREHADHLIQILMKQGESSVSNRMANVHQDAVLDAQVRLRDLTASIPSNTRIYGGFDGDLTGTDTSRRNPVIYQSILTGNVTGQDFDDNVAHVMTIADAENVVVDGLHIQGGNTKIDPNLLLPWPRETANGAGMLITNSSNVQLRNIDISHCLSQDGLGAAIYAENTTGLTIANAIVHNNTSLPLAGQPSAIHLANGTNLTIDHALIRANVGAITADASKVVMTNSALHVNGTAETDGEQIDGNADLSSHLMHFTLLNSGSASGSHTLFDDGARIDGFTDSQAVLTYNRGTELSTTYPEFVNPTTYVGVNRQGDVTLYGGDADFTPRAMNPMVNFAESTPNTTDMTLHRLRNNGGGSDAGPLENTELMSGGKVIYVRDYGNTTDPGGDGSSWANAINGNCIGGKYTNNHGFSGVDAEIYANGTVLTGLQWAVDEAYYRSLEKTGTSIKMTTKRGVTKITDISKTDPGEWNSFKYTTRTNQTISVSTPKEEERVQVWVAEGEYTRTDGFFMRDGVDVYAGFPGVGNPSMDERHPKNYETIIQTNTNEQIANNSFTWGPQTCDKKIIDSRYFTIEAHYELNYYTNAYKSRRVLTQPYPYYSETVLGDMEKVNNPVNPFNFVTTWDGLTIRNGRTRIKHERDGGAGFDLRHNGVLSNCVIENNINKSKYQIRAGGIFLNGGTIQNCIVRNNHLVQDNPSLSSSSIPNLGSSQHDTYGGGMYLRQGVVYNTLFYDNKIYLTNSNFVISSTTNSDNGLDGSAVHFENGEFYNNTVTRNYGNHAISTGNWFSNGSIAMFNTIIYGNMMNVGDKSSTSRELRGATSFGYFSNCLLANSSKANTSGATVMNPKYGDPKFVNATDDEPDLRLQLGSPAINTATETLKYADKEIELPDVDADYTDRIKDCALDIGAFEFNGSAAITPSTTASNVAVFYVSGPGAGSRDGSSPQNAACAQKLQYVLNAAGRYKYANPGQQVEVRLAEYDQYIPTVEAKYDTYGNLIGAENSSNPRNYSILVPRGVSLMGGFNQNDFSEANRDILKYQSVLLGQYVMKGNDVNSYHVLAFTDAVMSADNKPTGQKLSDVTSDRAIVDGCFITGGIANGQDDNRTPNNSGSIANIDNYLPDHMGGAAVLPSFAHLRNCVIEKNEALSGGGALLMKPQSLVSGCIIRSNHTDGQGGAIYVYEPLAEENLFPTNPSNVPGKDNPAVYGNEYPFANIFTSTIVNNTANIAGGIYFTSNLRINSSVLWRNSASSNANIVGQISPAAGSAVDLSPWEYPMQYCAVENMKASGLNNISVAMASENGVRWDYSDFTNDDKMLNDETFFFDLMSYSLLTRSGTPMTEYENLRTLAAYFTTLEQNDISNAPRIDEKLGDQYIEIGARAYNAQVHIEPEFDTLMQRIYVCEPEDTRLDYAIALQKQTENAYYQQEGSSLAYPFHRLDDALEYIIAARKKALSLLNDPNSTNEQKEHSRIVANAVFEIFMTQGTHYPRQNVEGAQTTTGFTRGNTFLIPENVSIYGGISNEHATVFYGKETSGDLTLGGVTISGKTTSDILDARPRYDVNQNGIIEGWGLQQQTILSGNVTSDQSSSVFHVITANANEDHVGALPEAEAKMAEDDWDGSTARFRGQPIILDGLQITDGHAMNYDTSVHSATTYYKGGAICVDGNWITGGIHKDLKLTAKRILKETGEVTNPDNLDKELQIMEECKRSVGYRDIPLIIRNCLITNNKASMGGAIFTNGELQVYSSQFAANRAEVSEDKDVDFNGFGGYRKFDFTYSGRGGAIDASSYVTLVNTIFANNTAYSEKDEDLYGAPCGSGGAITLGEHASLVMLNCDVVRNKANAYPAIYAYSPNKGFETLKDEHLAQNNRNQIVNTIFWGNENTRSDEADYGMLLNVPKGDNLLHNNGETLWFCAYEEGRWLPVKSIIAQDQESTINFRTAQYLPEGEGSLNDTYIPSIMDRNYRDKVRDIANYNFNIYISSDNYANDGPNFISPALRSGSENYTPAADWMIGRINNLVDQGWSFLQQDLANESFVYDGSYPKGSGIYTDLTKLMNATDRSRDGVKNMPIGDDLYMFYNSERDDQREPLLRISKDPNPSHQQTYIDIGAYEYQHVKLNISSYDEVDVLWVAAEERQNVGGSDGSTWQKATSDLQRAIETLLSSRNDHHKEIRLLSGNYMPVYTISGNMAFTINTAMQDNNPTFPDNSGEFRGVKSLTIRGGYSNQYEGPYDPVEYNTTISMAERIGVTDNLLQHTFIIADARNRKSAYGVAESTPTDYVIPITFEGITFTNAMAQIHKEPNAYPGYENKIGGSAIYYRPQFADIENGIFLKGTESGAPSFTLKNCRITLSSAEVNPSPAVAIAKSGGRALIYNTLFDRNRGQSLGVEETDVVNCTFALNGGPIHLFSNSGLYNSILWQNGGEEVKTDGDFKPEYIRYNSISGYTGNDNNNTSLSAQNDDVLNGPNFADPTNGDFSVLPSMKISSTASTAIYNEKVIHSTPIRDLGTMPAVEKYNDEYPDIEMPNQTTDPKMHYLQYLMYRDLGSNLRYLDGGLERGAYEVTTPLNRVLYLNPNNSGGNTGASWQNAFGPSQLQEAVDAAAVYSSANKGVDAFVFVKGENDINLGSVTMRNGVQVYGSLQPDFVLESQRDNQIDKDTEKINAYIAEVRSAHRRAVASPVSEASIISAISATQSGLKAQIEGFALRPAANVDYSNSPVLSTASGISALAIKNVSVAGYDNAKLFDLQGPTLIYNSLVRDCLNPVVSSLSANAYFFHSTIGLERNYLGSAKVINSIVNADRASFAASHLMPEVMEQHSIGDTPYQPYGEAMDIQWQLPEKSQLIASATSGISELPATLSGYVNLASDRDLLGNPMTIHDGKKRDPGCFQTWQLSEGEHLVATSEADNFGGNYHPHIGSVVYLLNGSRLTLEDSHFNADYALRPAYFLGEQGSSLYGQGNHITMQYAAYEQPMQYRYSLIALPFASIPSRIVGADFFSYDGETRAAYGYKFNSDDSPCWKPIADGSRRDACEGFLIDLGEGFSQKPVRFTSADATPVYTENGDDKLVSLIQYDHNKYVTQDPGFDFTHEYDMGWNLRGLPYFISGYDTAASQWVGAEEQTDGYMMSAPHLLYSLTADNNYKSFKSWQNGGGLSFGSGFFTQTMVLADTEQLTFHTPISPDNASDTRADEQQPLLVKINGAEGEDGVSLWPSENGSLQYSLGADAAKLRALNEELPQIYAIGTSQLRMSLLSSAPRETRIPLGVSFPKQGEYVIALADMDTKEEVWLHDTRSGMAVNLSNQSYPVIATEPEEEVDRFYLTIGQASIDKLEAQFTVELHGNEVLVKGLQGGEILRLFSLDGKLLWQTRHEGSGDFREMLEGPATYVLTVDNQPTKLRIR